MGLLEFSDTCFQGVGKGAFLVTKQFAFEKRFGKRGTIDRHKRFVLSFTLVVNLSTRYFFSRAIFTQKQ